MTLQEQITQLTADLAECRKWLKEANLKFDDSDFRVSELLKQNRMLATELDKLKVILKFSKYCSVCGMTLCESAGHDYLCGGCRMETAAAREGKE